ncbi:MAG: hypothetical protein V4519_02850 [Patescibacteria group bacterium]
MSVEFESEEQLNQYSSRKIFGAPETPAMIRGLKKMGVKEAYAHHTLIGIIIACVVLSIFIFVYFVIGIRSTPDANPEVIRQMELDRVRMNTSNE